MNSFDKRLVQVARAFRDMGGTHTLEDLMYAIETGEMQSFAEGGSWVVTQILRFPRKKVLEIFLYVGDLDDLQKLHDRIVAFARFEDCDIIRAIGRDGWTPFADRKAWHKGASVFWKEI